MPARSKSAVFRETPAPRRVLISAQARSRQRAPRNRENLGRGAPPNFIEEGRLSRAPDLRAIWLRAPRTESRARWIISSRSSSLPAAPAAIISIAAVLSSAHLLRATCSASAPASWFFSSASASRAAIRFSRSSMACDQRSIQKMLQQRHQDQEVDDLRDDGEPIDQHALASGLRRSRGSRTDWRRSE